MHVPGYSVAVQNSPNMNTYYRFTVVIQDKTKKKLFFIFLNTRKFMDYTFKYMLNHALS